MMLQQQSFVRTQQASMACSATRVSSLRLRRAFSLVELVVVIGIIVLLVGLTVGVLTSLTRGSETRTTENMLQLLDNAYAEWKLVAERDITYGVSTAGVVYDVEQMVPGGPNTHEPTDEILSDLLESAPSRNILKSISSDLLQAPSTAHSETRLIDAWDNEIITVFPGRLWFTGDPYPKDIDGTIRTEFEQAFGICTNRRVRFVSAGPDGREGNLAYGSPTQQDIDDAKDNIYSYPLETP